MSRPLKPGPRRTAVAIALVVPALLGTSIGSAAALPAATGPAVEAVEPVATPEPPARATDPGSYVTTAPGQGRFPLVEHGAAASIVVSSQDFPGVVRVVDDLAADLEKVTGVKPAVARDAVPSH